MAIKWLFGGFATFDRNVSVLVSDLITKLCVSRVQPIAEWVAWILNTAENMKDGN